MIALMLLAIQLRLTWNPVEANPPVWEYVIYENNIRIGSSATTTWNGDRDFAVGRCYAVTAVSAVGESNKSTPEVCFARPPKPEALNAAFPG